ncbi:MAG: hypothetical protein ACE5GK_01465 [Nitrospiria bacterium]
MTLRDTTVRKFTKRIEGLISNHGELKLAIHNKRNEAVLENELVVQFVLQAAVLWESFQNDIILAYIEKSPSKALTSLEERIKQSVEDKFGKSCRRAITFSRPGNLTRTVLASLLDQKGWNISVKDAERLSTNANTLLASRFAKKFSLDRDDSEFYDYAISLRNYLSHYSSDAKSELKKKIGALCEPTNAPLKAQLRTIEGYLKAHGGTATTRAVFVVERMKQIAAKL